ncbi:Cytochrome p450 [Thalictrum thalictroides]|uniref:Cytochrome p450 n=1 Tax=Thalictrum thalictroides TaxID=46969 RepID=A0A7J6V512_THATH|nr:Cytochrome p450 [Thalictrum thalictroides]
MGFVQVLMVSFIFILWKLLSSFWISPHKAYQKLQNNGFTGPSPSFPLGNTKDMKRSNSSSSSFNFTNDIHSIVFPYFVRWRKSYGKVFIYWLGTEPFLYVGEPEFLKQMASGILGKNWGKPNVFKHDRKPMFGNGLVMLEGDNWAHHRHLINPAFSSATLKGMTSLMVESTNNMLDHWSRLIASGEPEIDVEKEVISTAAEIIAKSSFGMDDQKGREVFEKLRALQVLLFQSNRLVGVPFSKLMYLRKTLQTRRLGKEIDRLLLSLISSREASFGEPQQDLLGLLLADNYIDGHLEKKLTNHELVDECKTFFFGGHETTALALIWTLLLLALHPEWQNQLREEIKQVMEDKPLLDYSMLARLKKMGWVMNEVLRLYSPAPNVQRQTRGDIQVGDNIIPSGTNMWIDVVGMHHDPELWGDDVYDFKPERFKDSLHGGCNHKMGYLPFGFGGRMCVGRNLSMMEYRVVLTLVLSRFSFSVSPNYVHSPAIMLSLRPSQGLPLIFQHL